MNKKYKLTKTTRGGFGNGKNTIMFREAVKQALDGEEVLYSTPKGNIVVRSVEKDKELLDQYADSRLEETTANEVG